MEMKIKLDEGAKVSRAHSTDAGLDLHAREDKVVPARGSAVFNTGVHVELPPSTMGEIRSKSGLNRKFGLTSEGTVDVGYTGSIVIVLYNHSEKDYLVKAGDKISQLVITPILIPTLKVVDSLEDTERGDKGFGSSGR
jgi:dUTP pyrophosphatase